MPLGYRRNVPLLFLYWTLLHAQFWLPVWLAYFQQRGLTLTQIGVLEAVAWALMAAVEVPAGALADAYSRKAALATGALLYACAMWAVTTQALSPVFLAGYLLWGVAFSAISGADLALLYDSLDHDGRARQYARLAGWQSALLHLVPGLASLAGAWLFARDGALPFWVAGALAALAAAVALALREPPRAAGNSAGPLAADSGEGRAAAHGLLATLAALVQVLRQRDLAALLLLDAAVAVGASLACFVGLQPYAAELDVPPVVVGVVTLAVRAAGAAGSLCGGRAADRLSQPVLTAAPLTLAACQWLLSAAPSPGALALFAVAALAAGVVRPVLSHRINQAVPAHHRATVLSVQSLLFTAGMALAEPAFLAASAQAGTPAALGLTGLAVGAASLAALVWCRGPSHWQRSRPLRMPAHAAPLNETAEELMVQPLRAALPPAGGSQT